MRNYLLSVIQPEGNPPPPEILNGIMRDVDAFNEELKAAGAWVLWAACMLQAQPPCSGNRTARCS